MSREPLTREYAELALRLSFFCASIDIALCLMGKPPFAMNEIRADEWNLTEQQFEDMAKRAREMGIPESVIQHAITEGNLLATDKALLDHGLKMQAIVDAAPNN